MENNKISLIGKNFKTIKPIKIETSENFTMDVEVENSHYYTLSNGIISHNSTSILTQSSSGIEPVFMTFYKRRRKILSDETTIDFVDAKGDKWQEY